MTRDQFCPCRRFFKQPGGGFGAVKLQCQDDRWCPHCIEIAALRTTIENLRFITVTTESTIPGIPVKAGESVIEGEIIEDEN